MPRRRFGRGAEFSYRTVSTGIFHSSTGWTFRFTSDEEGTRIEQSYRVDRHRRPIDLFDRVSGHTEVLERGMRKTLQASRKTLEA